MSLLRESQCARVPESSIGGKAYNLGRLSRAGFSVPPWCVIPADSQVSAAEISKWMADQVAVGHHRFIVRSSMSGEDGLLQSYAGQLISVPNLTTIGEILEAIQVCIQSGASERVNLYRGSSSKDKPAPVAVILQVMVDADRSGVLFTADPKDGSRTRFLISALYGACEAVVGGQYDCDEYQVQARDGKVQSKLALKKRALSFDHSGLKEVEVLDKLQATSTLSEKDLSALTQLGRELTIFAGHPLDIEWVMRGDQLWVVQMRPITSLGLDRSAEAQFVFDNSNIQESYNGLTLPLTFRFASVAYHRVYRQVMELMGFSAQEVSLHDRRHHQMLGLLNGRVYYNINSWYEGLLLIPSFHQNKQDMEHMMGVEESVPFVENQKFSRREKIRKIPRVARLLLKMASSFLRLDRSVQEFRIQFQRTYDSFPRNELKWMSLQGLFTLVDDLTEQVLPNWKAPILNDFYLMMTSGRVRRALSSLGLENRLPDLLAGEDLESTKPTKNLLMLSDRIKTDPELTQVILNESESSFLEALKSRPQIKELVEAYIEKYGDRVVGELKLETKTLRQNQGFLVRILRSYVGDPSLNFASIQEKQQRLRQDAEREVGEAIQAKFNFFAARTFHRNLKKFRKAVADRESMRLDRTRSFGLFRSIAVVIGEKLFEQGFLDQPEDIFYLTFDEADDFCHGKAFFSDPRALIQLRKNQYESWAEANPPGHVQTPLPTRSFKDRKTISSTADLQGQGCYPGVIEGEVMIVSDPTQAHNLKGKIMVAERTDPGWTPLFLQVAGLIVERGSQLSHSAVVARELGLPTIVAVPGACHSLKNGEFVRLDGQAGTIVRLKGKGTPSELETQGSDLCASNTMPLSDLSL